MLMLAQFLRGRSVGHGSVLLFGLVVYVVLPFAAYGSGLYEGGPGEAVWARSFEGLYARSGPALALTLACLLAYALGTLLPLPRVRQPLDRPLRPGLLAAVLLGLGALWVFYIVQARELLFSGYLLDYRPDLMGPLASINLALLLLVLNLWQWRHSPRLLWAAGVLLALNSVALLSMGGRLYVAAVLVGLMLMALNLPAGRRPAARLKALAGLVLVAGLLALVGLLRVDMDVNLAALGRLLLAEPLLTSISLGTLMDCSLVDWLALPRNFLSSIVNFVPSGLLPGKEALMVELDPSGNCLASPFGATHLGAALLVNFGILGLLPVVTAFAVLMRLVQRHVGPWLYCYLCSLLPFMLFRDGFLIFNKAFFATGLLLALLLLGLSRRQRRRRVAGPAMAPGLL